MAVFSTNQNRQLYVVTGVTNTSDDLVESKTNAGLTLSTLTSDNDLYFQQISASGKIVRSDLIPAKSIVSASYTAADNMKQKIKTSTLTLDANVNGGAPLAGQDYIVRVNFRLLYGMSDEDIYQKYGAVHATASMTAAQFYQAMAYSLVKNFSRVYAPLLEVSFDGTTPIARASKNATGYVFYDATGATIDGSSAAKIVIAEKTQEDEYVRGVKQIVPVYFEVIPTTITVAGDEVVWGTVVNATADGLDNGYNIADLEYFCMGERGDQYRNIMWPKSIPTEYLADPTSAYNVINIHYTYAGTCEDVQKSEKDITLVTDDEFGAIITNINSALTVAGVPTLSE